MKSNLALACLALIALSGCTSSRGFDRGALSRAAMAAPPETEASIEKVLDRKPQLPETPKLGVFFRAQKEQERSPYLMYSRRNEWEWTPEEKAAFLTVCDALVEEGRISEAVFISPQLTNGETLEAIRLAAARHGADAVLVVSGAADVDHYNNALASTYALLVTALFVPGTVVDSMFISHAALWDVRNEYLYASVEADGTATSTRPAAMVNEDEVLAEAKGRSVQSLVESVDQHLRNLIQ